MKNNRALRRLLPAALLAVCLVLLSKQGDAANPFYNASGAPAQGSGLSSTVMRTEFANIGAGFDKMPGLSGFSGTAIVVNGGGTGLTNTVGTLVLGGNLLTAGALSTTGAYSLTLAQTGNVTLTLPSSNDTLVGRTTTDTLTNKTISGSTNTLSNIGNASLTNSAVTIAGHSVSLGGSTAIAAADLSNGVTGSGAVVLASGGTLTNPIVGTQSAGDNSTKAASTAYIDTLIVKGTWTPALVGSTSGSATLSVAVGSYVKIGNWYLATCLITVTSANSFVGNALITGLPWTQANVANDQGLGAVSFFSNLGFGGGYSTPGVQVLPGTNYVTILQSGPGAAVSVINMTSGNFAASSPTSFVFIITGHT